MGWADAVPDEVRAAAYDVFEWRVAGAPVADLFYDSIEDAPARPRGRSRWLRFRHREELVELRVEPLPRSGALAVSVQVLPPRRVLVQFGRPGSRTSVRTTSGGHAQLRGVRPGLADLVLRGSPAARPTLKTATVRL